MPTKKKPTKDPRIHKITVFSKGLRLLILHIKTKDVPALIPGAQVQSKLVELLTKITDDLDELLKQ
jgi:hypothetical protein